ncbi:MAG: MerC domain-containing protein [Erythrobacter sp.]
MPSSIRQRFDRLGLLFAGLCAVHCIATIVLVSVVGIGGHFLLAPEIHEIGLMLAVIFSAFAIGWGVLVHRKVAPTVLAVSGLGMMAGALMVGHGTSEVVLTIVGVVLVAAGHMVNLRSAN